MARSLGAVILLFAATAFAQEPGASEPRKRDRERDGDGPPRFGRGGPMFIPSEMEPFQKAVFALKPELREQFLKTATEWAEKAKAAGPDKTPEGDPIPSGPEFEPLRVALKDVPDSARRRFFFRAGEFFRLSPEKRKDLLDLAKRHRDEQRREAERVMGELGLQLADDRKEEFIRRYLEARGKIEMECFRELERIREPKVRELKDRLKQEFSGSAATAPGEKK